MTLTTIRRPPVPPAPTGLSTRAPWSAGVSAPTARGSGRFDPDGRSTRRRRTPTPKGRDSSLDSWSRDWLIRLFLAIAAISTLAGCTPSHTDRPAASAQSTTQATPSGVSGTALNEEAPPHLQDAIDRARQVYDAPGALAVVHIDGQRFEITSGMADLTGTPVSANMQFRVGSITKTVVAALVLDQVGQGRLSLDDIVGNIVGDPLRPEPPITLRMLLDHTSGIFDIGNDGDPVADVARLDDRGLIDEASTLQDAASAGKQVVASDRLIVGLAETHDRYFQPGAGFHYSNTNYQLAAMTLEVTGGRSLAELVEERLSRPLGLDQTTLAPDDLRSPAFRGYATDQATGDLVDATDDLFAFGNGGNGGLISTADELTTLMNAIVDGPLLPADIRAAMRQPTPESGYSYGLGLAVYRLDCGVFYGHEGRVNGTASIALVDASRAGRSVVAAFNQTSRDPHLVSLAEQLICPPSGPHS